MLQSRYEAEGAHRVTGVVVADATEGLRLSGGSALLEKDGELFRRIPRPVLLTVPAERLPGAMLL
ncbi:hypothetical protein [Streptomyces sp. NPDC048357]|uniref:hypothetical protein n=1 Tax=Streptomyces sp. NPDC048357 TaxID=3154719 RepID=UPI003426B7F1